MFTGEYAFCFQEIEWSLLRRGEVLCNSDSPDDWDGPIAENLALLEGRTIERVTFTTRGRHMTLYLSGGFKIKTRSIFTSNRVQFSFFITEKRLLFNRAYFRVHVERDYFGGIDFPLEK